MFRFIHAADPHLDSPLRGLEARDDAPARLLRGATRRAFENLVNLAITEKVDFLLIAGDLYDGDWKDYNTGLFFRSQMVRLNKEGIPVFLITGNHDAASIITKKLTLPENVRVFSTRTAESKEVPGFPAVVHGRGFPHRAVLENLAQNYPPAIAEKFNIGLLHTSLNGRPGHDSYAPCSVSDLKAKSYDYWALGHIHQPEVISDEPWIVFAGNCQGRHAREIGPRGCYLVTVDDHHEVEAVDWCELDVVRWEVVEVDLADVDEEMEILRRIRVGLSDAIDHAGGRLLAARVSLSGACPLHGLLLRETSRFRAETAAIAQDFGTDAIWIEQVKVATTPVYDLGIMADRDALTKTVLETLETATHQAETLPADILEMIKVLPSELQIEVEDEWDPSQRSALLEDVRSIILETLRTKGDPTV